MSHLNEFLQIGLKVFALGSILYWLIFGRKKWDRQAAEDLSQFANMFLTNVITTKINPTGIAEVSEVDGSLGEDLIRLRQDPARKNVPPRTCIRKSLRIPFAFTMCPRYPWWTFGLKSPLLLDVREVEIGLDKKFRILVDAPSSGAFTAEQSEALIELTTIPNFYLAQNNSIDGFVVTYDGYVFGGPAGARSAGEILKKSLRVL